jgi:hypothetical protein
MCACLTSSIAVFDVGTLQQQQQQPYYLELPSHSFMPTSHL